MDWGSMGVFQAGKSLRPFCMETNTDSVVRGESSNPS